MSAPLTSIQLRTLALLRQGETHRDVARTQRVSPKAIEMRVYRARQRLLKSKLCMPTLRLPALSALAS